MKLLNLTIGTASIGMVQLASMIDPTDLPKIGQLIIQILIGAVTLWQMLKKQSPKP